MKRGPVNSQPRGSGQGLVLVPVILGCVMPAVSPLAQEPPDQPWVQSGSKGSQRLKQDQHTWTTFAFSTKRRTVSISVAYSSLSGDTLAFETETRSVPYWPTDIEPIQNGTKVVVAGRARNLDTVLEVWTLSPPIHGLAQGPDGETIHTITPPNVTEVDELYRENAPGLNMIASIEEKFDAVPRILVQFYSRSDIHEFDLSTREHQQIVCTEPALARPGSIVAPTLGPTLFSGRGKHLVHGHVYFFRNEDEFPWLALMDTDKNGSIDGHMLIHTLVEWRASGFAEDEAYE